MVRQVRLEKDCLAIINLTKDVMQESLLIIKLLIQGWHHLSHTKKALCHDAE